LRGCWGEIFVEVQVLLGAFLEYALVAQLVEAAVSNTVKCESESHQEHIFFDVERRTVVEDGAVAQLGER
jgi:hypothetical protein